jgi:hypothetical protein
MDEEKDQHVTAAPVTSESVDLGEEKKVWQMPEPVFRQSSGYEPKAFQKQLPVNDGVAEPASTVASSVSSNGSANAAIGTAAAPAVAFPPSSEIQPQPDIVEDLLADREPAARPAAPERSPGMRLFLAALGIAAMVVFAIAFIAVIYYLFFYHPGESNSLLN